MKRGILFLLCLGMASACIELNTLNDKVADYFNNNISIEQILFYIDEWYDDCTCPDGTENLNCSVSKPLMCINKTLIPDCETCGCETGVCKDGDCVTCTDECVAGRQCLTNTSYSICMDFDGDGCTELGNEIHCTGNCSDGYCLDSSGEIGLFAINEGNFNQYVGVRSYYYTCSGPSYTNWVERITQDELVNQDRLFTIGWSCGATYALLYGFQNPHRFRGIVHINQHESPYMSNIESAFAEIVPVYIVHDWSLDSGGQYLYDYLVSKGYVINETVFVMNRPGTGHSPYLTDDEKDIIYEWFKTI